MTSRLAHPLGGFLRRCSSQARLAVASQPLSPLAMGRLAVLGVAVRVLYIVHQIPGYVPRSDARNYYYLARYFSEGKGFSDTFPLLSLHHTAFRPPAFPVLLGSVFVVTGPSIGVAQAVNVTIGTLVVVLGAVLAARLGGRWAGVATGVVLAGYPPLLANDTTVLTEPLSLLLLVVLGLALCGDVWRRGSARRGWRDPGMVVAGVATGLLTLSRPSAQGLAVVLVAWIWWRVGWRRAVLFAGITALVVLPWLVRNQVRWGLRCWSPPTASTWHRATRRRPRPTTTSWTSSPTPERPMSTT